MNLTESDGPRQRGWRRVGRANPCPVCGKPKWCLVTPDGSAAICARVADGAVKRAGQAGWLHRLRQDTRGRPEGHGRGTIRLVVPSVPRQGMADRAERCRAAVDSSRLDRLARGLGLSVDGLLRLGIGWCDLSHAWSFPMVDAHGQAVGIRLRTDLGQKFAAKGSKEGLFLPTDFDGTGLVLICEGPTDTAAMLDLRFQAVGRPSCTGGAALLVTLVKLHRPGEVVILADRDQPGQEGALDLVPRLVIHVPILRLLTPLPGKKDARAWKQAGASRAEVLEAIKSAQTHRLSIRAGEVRPGR
jgi:hypothetical protein